MSKTDQGDTSGFEEMGERSAMMLNGSQPPHGTQTSSGGTSGRSEPNATVSAKPISPQGKLSLDALRASSPDASSADGQSSTAKGTSRTQASANSESPVNNPKKDRSKLRKGKWTVEEEEYTSRIIHYFNAGLLSLPDGATLRSYLAEKLNCDPMRITKKYAGAACLGRRAQHFRDRAQPTITEIQLAKAELDHLERRFRLRIEEGQSSLPFTPPTDFLLSQQSGMMMMPNGAAANPAFQSLLLNLAAQQVLPQMPPSMTTPAPASSWLLPNESRNPLQGLQPAAAMPGVDPVMANWAFAQATASLAPAITQLAAENLRQQQQKQQRQLQQLQQKTSEDAIKEYTRQLQQSFEKQMKEEGLETKPSAPSSAPRPTSQQEAASAAEREQPKPRIQPPPPPQSTLTTAAAPLPPPAAAEPKKVEKAKPVPPAMADNVPSQNPVSEKPLAKKQEAAKPAPQKRRTEEDQQAGSILLGFLSSLRKSYEEALQEKKRSRPTDPFSGGESDASVVSSRIAAVTDTSGTSIAQNAESSEDFDWNSDKKTEPSSSEESDREPLAQKLKGPLRKRLKTKKVADESEQAE